MAQYKYFQKHPEREEVTVHRVKPNLVGTLSLMLMVTKLKFPEKISSKSVLTEVDGNEYGATTGRPDVMQIVA